MEFTLDGFMARGVTIREVIQEAYGVYEPDRLVTSPDWVNSTRFDIQAKSTTGDAKELEALTLQQRRLLLQDLLARRFHLRVRHTTKQLPVLELLVDKGGIKFHASKPVPEEENQVKGIDGLVLRSGNGFLEVERISMDGFAQILSNNLNGRIVLNKTDLKARYDLSLKWFPENEAHAHSSVTGSEPASLLPSTETGASLFYALRQQLGLRLIPAKAPSDVIVVDAIEQPSAN